MADESTSGDGFKLDKRISVGHILTTVTVAIALFTWAAKLETRIDRNELRIANAEQAVAELRINNASQYTEIIRRLERLDTNAQKHLELHSDR